MELLLFVLVVCVIGILATRFGYDSRAVPYSSEHQFARYGMVWEVHNARFDDLRRETRVWRLLQEDRPSRPRVHLRRRLAAALRALARWLSPEGEPAAAQAPEAARLVTLRAPGP